MLSVQQIVCFSVAVFERDLCLFVFFLFSQVIVFKKRLTTLYLSYH